MSETEKYDKAILQRLFPEISLTDKLVGRGITLLITVYYCSVEANCMKRNRKLIFILQFQSHKDWMSSFEKQAASKIKAASEKKDDVREFFFIQIPQNFKH